MRGSGLSTTALPRASAGATERIDRISGKLNGAITPTTPAGRRRARLSRGSRGRQDLAERVRGQRGRLVALLRGDMRLQPRPWAGSSRPRGRSSPRPRRRAAPTAARPGAAPRRAPRSWSRPSRAEPARRGRRRRATSVGAGRGRSGRARRRWPVRARARHRRPTRPAAAEDPCRSRCRCPSRVHRWPPAGRRASGTTGTSSSSGSSASARVGTTSSSTATRSAWSGSGRPGSRTSGASPRDVDLVERRPRRLPAVPLGELVHHRVAAVGQHHEQHAAAVPGGAPQAPGSPYSEDPSPTTATTGRVGSPIRSPAAAGRREAEPAHRRGDEPARRPGGQQPVQVRAAATASPRPARRRRAAARRARRTRAPARSGSPRPGGGSGAGCGTPGRLPGAAARGATRPASAAQNVAPGRRRTREVGLAAVHLGRVVRDDGHAGCRPRTSGPGS